MQPSPNLVQGTLARLSIRWMIVATLLPLSGCGPAGAPQEKLIVYTALEDDQLAVYRAAFERAHPEIGLEVLRDSTGIITARLLAEKDNPQADVIWGVAASSLLVCDAQGMLAGYTPVGLERVDPRFRDSRNPPRWVGIDAWMTGIVVNTVELEKLALPKPLGFEDLTNEAFRGHIVMPNPASSGTGYLTVSSILQRLGEDEGWAYLDKLHANIAYYTHSGSKPATLAGSGECVIGISFGYRGIREAASRPVETIFPIEGSGWDLEANALVHKDDQDPATARAARKFLDWAISDEAMRLYAESFAIVTADVGAKTPEGFPADPLRQLAPNDFAWAAENRKRILDDWSRRYAAKTESK